MRSVFLILLLVPLRPAHSPNPESFFELADSFFHRFINGGLVDYRLVNSNQAALNELANIIRDFDIQQASAQEQKAFYINAYNLLVIKSINERYPINSPMSIPGFFAQVKHEVGGEKLTLDDIEKKKLFKTTQDARLHFVLVCAAKSCPRIANFAYLPANLDDLLEKRTTMALNDPDFVKVGPKKVLVSQIFEWYKGDFAKDSSSILDYLNKYRRAPLDGDLKLGYYEWDWSLNDYGQ